jgi:hypothetical protein
MFPKHKEYAQQSGKDIWVESFLITQEHFFLSYKWDILAQLNKIEFKCIKKRSGLIKPSFIFI